MTPESVVGVVRRHRNPGVVLRIWNDIPTRMIMVMNTCNGKSGLQIRHFEKNSRTKKLITQGKNSITQQKNSRIDKIYREKKGIKTFLLQKYLLPEIHSIFIKKTMLPSINPIFFAK